MKFRSQIDFSLILFPCAMLLLIGTFSVSHQLWYLFVITILGVGILIHTITTSYCIIRKEDIEVKSGIFMHKYISKNSIRKLRSSKDYLSSPVLSFDRVALEYGDNQEVVFSVRNKEVFITKLQEDVPHIEIASGLI